MNYQKNCNKQRNSIYLTCFRGKKRFFLERTINHDENQNYQNNIQNKNKVVEPVCCYSRVSSDLSKASFCSHKKSFVFDFHFKEYKLIISLGISYIKYKITLKNYKRTCQTLIIFQILFHILHSILINNKINNP